MKMTEKLPFMNSTGLISKILDKIISAQTPPIYTTDFQSTVLAYGSGSARAFIPLLKRIGFLNPDGSPTDLYKEFRSASQRGDAMAKAIKHGYAPLYKVNEYAHELDTNELKEAIIRVTGLEKKSGSITAIKGTFEALKAYANFDNITDGQVEESTSVESSILVPKNDADDTNKSNIPNLEKSTNISERMTLSYTINLNLPASKDPEVFDAVFRSLKENLLGD